MSTPKITIDGLSIPFKQGQTIMDAALAAGIYIPRLCHHPDLIPHGSCKLCSINVNGRICSACTFPAADNQIILNNSEELNQARKAIVQMLFVEGNHICPGCEKSGDCMLQAVAYHLRMLDNRFNQFFPRREVDASHPDILLDRDRCIYCELCVRASRELDGKNVFAISGRGMASNLIVNSASGQLADSGLERTDRAANVCPVGAILPRRGAYKTPIGERTFDKIDISETLSKTRAADPNEP